MGEVFLSLEEAKGILNAAEHRLYEFLDIYGGKVRITSIEQHAYSHSYILAPSSVTISEWESFGLALMTGMGDIEKSINLERHLSGHSELHCRVHGQPIYRHIGLWLNLDLSGGGLPSETRKQNLTVGFYLPQKLEYNTKS